VSERTRVRLGDEVVVEAGDSRLVGIVTGVYGTPGRRHALVRVQRPETPPPYPPPR
jgi:hypothetical protein